MKRGSRHACRHACTVAGGKADREAGEHSKSDTRERKGEREREEGEDRKIESRITTPEQQRQQRLPVLNRLQAASDPTPYQLIKPLINHVRVHRQIDSQEGSRSDQLDQRRATAAIERTDRVDRATTPARIERER